MLLKIYVEDYFYTPGFKALMESLFPKESILYSSIKIINYDKYINIYQEDSHYVLEAMVNNKFFKDKENFKKINVYIDNNDKKKDVAIKKLLVRSFKGKKSIPWGILTGIRPSKIVHNLLDQNITRQDIDLVLTEEYLLSELKSSDLINISERQRSYLNQSKGGYSLYFSIPFCPSICSYCSFPTLPVKKYENIVSDYIDNLIYEFETVSKYLELGKLNSIYIGGGTPTSINRELLAKLINTINLVFKDYDIKEFTVEAGRPDSLDYDYLKMLKDLGVDRISINPQTMRDETLSQVGRTHKSSQIIEVYNQAKSLGFKTINMDLIIGLPGETIDDIMYTFKEIKKLKPNNLTIHSLAIKNGSNFKRLYNSSVAVNDEIALLLDNNIKQLISDLSLVPYYLYRQKQSFANLENVGYAKDGHISIYNISMMEERETILAFGMGAVSKIVNKDLRVKREANFKSLKDYIDRIDEQINKKVKHLHNNL